ncbi:hypothetical protein [Phenylobacterium sp.]|uniref:hypothetical protein n=1 Tax=Phenylobacterium sp. TaxID=1871053 RepID=UPI0030F3E1D9
MLYEYLGRCVAVAAFLPIESLNECLAVNDGDPSEDLIDTLSDPSFEGEDDMIVELQRRQIRKFVSQLPDRLKTIVIRHYWLGDRQEDIANDLGVTQSAISHAIGKVHRLGRQSLA